MTDRQKQDLKAVYREAERARTSRTLNQETFDRLLAQGREIVGPETYALEGLLMLGLEFGFIAT